MAGAILSYLMVNHGNYARKKESIFEEITAEKSFSSFRFFSIQDTALFSINNESDNIVNIVVRNASGLHSWKLSEYHQGILNLLQKENNISTPQILNLGNFPRASAVAEPPLSRFNFSKTNRKKGDLPSVKEDGKVLKDVDPLYELLE